MPPAVVEKIKVGPFAQLNRYVLGCFGFFKDNFAYKNTKNCNKLYLGTLLKRNGRGQKASKRLSWQLESSAVSYDYESTKISRIPEGNSFKLNLLALTRLGTHRKVQGWTRGAQREHRPSAQTYLRLLGAPCHVYYSWRGRRMHHRLSEANGSDRGLHEKGWQAHFDRLRPNVRATSIGDRSKWSGKQITF